MWVDMFLTFTVDIANGVFAAIYQGPWFSLDSGRMKRDLTYEIEHQDFLRMTITTCHRLEQLLISYEKLRSFEENHGS